MNDLGYATWADVELSQIGNLVALRVNNTPIMSYTNATGYTSGNIMIGYLDPFDPLGSSQSYAIIDNLRVVRLDGLKITSIENLGASMQLDFTYDLDDAPSAFKVRSGTALTSITNAPTATITQLSSRTYRATVTPSGDQQFYRILHP